MNKSVLFLILLVIAADIILFKIKKRMENLYDCKSIYNYVDLNGNKGISEHCFESEDKLICRDVKTIIIVSNFKEKKVCK